MCFLDNTTNEHKITIFPFILCLVHEWIFSLEIFFVEKNQTKKKNNGNCSSEPNKQWTSLWQINVEMKSEIWKKKSQKIKCELLSALRFQHVQFTFSFSLSLLKLFKRMCTLFKPVALSKVLTLQFIWIHMTSLAFSSACFYEYRHITKFVGGWESGDHLCFSLSLFHKCPLGLQVLD